MIPAEDAPKLESDFHSAFNDRMVNKVNTRKEFFRVTLDEIRHFLDREGIDAASAKFTMRAEARQFRESQAIDALPEKQREKALQRILESDASGDGDSEESGIDDQNED